EKGEKHQVGVTIHQDSLDEPLDILRVSHEVERSQNEVLAGRREARDNQRVDQTLAQLRTASRGTENLVPVMLEAVRAEATLGEICGVLREEWGEYREPARV
ncbi:MAG: methylmalonyl-CoA mutase family protein, partial [Candidatus Nanopelagicales bacterium]